MTMAPSQLGVFTKSDEHLETPNLQYHVQPLSLDKFESRFIHFLPSQPRFAIFGLKAADIFG